MSESEYAGPTLERPEGYSDPEWAAFLNGFSQAALLFREAGNEWYVAVERLAQEAESEAPRGAPAPGTAEGGEDEEELCPDCGAPMIHELGSPDPVCLDCERT